MTFWQKIALGLGDALGGVLGGVFDAFMRFFGVDMQALRAQAAEEQAAQRTQEAVEAKRAQERAEDVALKEATLAALLDLRADLATPEVTAWEPPERGQVDGAVAAERRARHAAIKAASELEVKGGEPAEPIVDLVARWRVA